MISGTVLTIVLVAAGQLFVRASRGFSALTQRTHLSTRAQVVADRIQRELFTGVFLTLEPAQPAESSWLRFQRPLDLQGGVPVLDDPTQVELFEVATGEFGIRVWRDRVPYGTSPGDEDSTTVLAEGLRDGDLKFTRSGALLLVELTLRLTEGASEETSTVFTQVRMRNGG